LNFRKREGRRNGLWRPHFE